MQERHYLIFMNKLMTTAIQSLNYSEVIYNYTYQWGINTPKIEIKKYNWY